MASRVAVDARLWDASGIGRYLREVVPRVIRGADHGYALLGDPARIAAELGPDGRIELVEARAPIYSVAEQVELWRRTPRADLFWAPHYNVPLLRRGRLLATVHDVLHLARPDFVGGAHRRAYARAMFAAVARRATAVLCVSAFTADELARRAGVARSRIRVVHNGVGAEWFLPPEGGSPRERPYFLFVGNVKPHKNLVRLVGAFASVADRVPHDLVIVGRREGFLTGDARVARLAEGLGERVAFTGEVPDERLRHYVAHAESLVFPSLYEGFGLPPLEAMAAGCPALVSRTAAMPEVCGDAALYFDPQDTPAIAGAMLRVATEPGLREELAGRGRERARGFTWERTAAGTAAVLDAALARG